MTHGLSCSKSGLSKCSPKSTKSLFSNRIHIMEPSYSNKKNLILDKSFEFALIIITLVKVLRSKREFVFADQLLKAGTSIGANVEEANASVSKKEFHSKMGISSKEARETRYWLRLLKKSKIIDEKLVDDAIRESEEINRILTSIVKTTKESLLKASDSQTKAGTGSRS